MRGLLKTILVWFLAAMVIIFCAILLTIVLSENGPFFTALRSLVRNAMSSYAHQTIVIYERDGAQAATEFLNDVQRSAHIEVELFGAQSQPTTARALWAANDELMGLVNSALQSETPTYRVSLKMTRFAIPMRSRNGELYCFAGKLPASYAQNWRIDSRAFIWRFLVGIVTGALVCYWLARHLTRPIAHLQQATRRIAAGDLAARVSPALEQRNDEISDLAKDFNRMADRVSALLEDQRRLLGDISHELRSPLTRLNIALALARQQTGDIASAELDRIEREAERLNEMIGQLLELARVENNALQAGFEPIDLPRLLTEIATDADFEARSHQRSVVLACRCAATIDGPPVLLRSAIENAVRNAVRYTADDTAVGIELLRESSWFVIRVTDHGPGVPDEALEKLFQPFFRVSTARERDSGGTGLGLAITARTVGLLGGLVNAFNQKEGGLCVELRLPV